MRNGLFVIHIHSNAILICKLIQLLILCTLTLIDKYLLISIHGIKLIHNHHLSHQDIDSVNQCTLVYRLQEESPAPQPACEH